MGIVMTAALFVALLLLASLGLRAIEGIERENRLIESELETSQLYRESLAARAEQVRRYRHDADGLLRAIEYTLENDEPARVAGPVSSHAADSASDLATGEHPFLLADAAIESKRRLCASKTISFSSEIDPEFAAAAVRCNVNEADLCIVLQNLLDNAYEASLKAQSAGVEPSIALSLESPDEKSLLISVNNRIAGSKPPDFRTHKERPELHGVGLTLVNNIAKTYRGSLTHSFDSDAQILTMTVKLT